MPSAMIPTPSRRRLLKRLMRVTLAAVSVVLAGCNDDNNSSPKQPGY